MKVKTGAVSSEIKDNVVNASAVNRELSCRTTAMMTKTPKVAMGAKSAGELAIVQ